MPRSQREGLNYFPVDVDIFSDKKIKIAMARFGADAFAFYIYLLCEIYRDKGYYLQTDDDFIYITSLNLNMSSDKIGQMLNFFIGRSLFDDTLFSTDKVLSSPGLQRRFQEAVKSRALKTPVAVDAKFWLLSEEETQSFIKVTHIDDTSEKIIDNSTNNDLNSEKITTKESKVKKSKVNESKGEESSKIRYADFVFLLPQEYDLLGKQYGDKREALIKTLNDWKIESKKTCDNDYNDYNALTSWVPDRYQKILNKTSLHPMKRQRYNSTADLDADAAQRLSWNIVENTLKEKVN